MITVTRQGGFIQIHDNRDRLPENVSKAKYCIKQVENCKKKVLRRCCPKSEKMLKFCSKVKKVLKSAGNVK